MTLAIDRAKDLIEQTDSAVADGDLTAFQNCMVIYSTQSSGNPKVKAPTGQGVDWAGVGYNTSDDPATDGKRLEFVTKGIVKIKADASFDAGIKLAINGTAGKVAAASSGDYVIGKSREAATGADHLVSVQLVSPGQQLN